MLVAICVRTVQAGCGYSAVDKISKLAELEEGISHGRSSIS
jgi:hypothetical protein